MTGHPDFDEPDPTEPQRGALTRPPSPSVWQMVAFAVLLAICWELGGAVDPGAAPGYWPTPTPPPLRTSHGRRTQAEQHI